MLDTIGEAISGEFVWNPMYRHTGIGSPRRTYIDQLVEDTGYQVEDIKTAMGHQNEGKTFYRGAKPWFMRQTSLVENIHSGSHIYQ
ncbi:Hypothetical predicted protein [Octopus vulgaris]|uniref:Uncharacterized protein n=1 Tax=Octopus vulgaris TaxID=6645 RepID=A0AA36FG31_OCTVU|nr:Hypothetical predicted protein [Octopus vulgaris]